MTCLLQAPGVVQDPEGQARKMLILLNSAPESCKFIIPPVAKGINWRLLLDTSAPAPGDVYPDADGPALPKLGKLELEGRSTCCFVAHRSQKDA